MTQKQGQNIPFFRPNLWGAETEVLKVLKSGFLTTGSVNRSFASEFATYLGVKDCVLTSSWTTGAEVLLSALGIGPGDEVIVPEITFVATANVVRRVGATPVLAEVESETGLLDLDKLKSKINENTKAVWYVTLYGNSRNLKNISSYLRDHKIYLLEDSAHNVEGEAEGVKPGAHSTAAVFSFYATKTLASGEGGAIVSNDSNLIDKIRPLLIHGMDASAIDRYSKAVYSHYDVKRVGYKANLPDVNAAMLSPQLRNIETQWSKKHEAFEIYSSLCRSSEIRYIPTIPGSKRGYHLFPILVDNRDSYLRRLGELGIGVAVNFRALSQLSLYSSYGGINPNASIFGNRVLSLPFFMDITEGEIRTVVEAIERTRESIRKAR